MKKTIKVVAAIIENENKEILCALRSNSMKIGGYWEFPGGKIELGESPKDAIVREVKEELNCTISCDGDIFDSTVYEYDEFIINLICLKCNLISGQPTKSEHAKLIWMSREYLSSLNWAPADINAINKLIAE